MTFSGRQVELTNWSKSAYSECLIYKASDLPEISMALKAAQAQQLSVIPHGTGHSYTDAALNTRGVVLDVTPMQQILSWDAARGIMQVEPGVTIREMVQVAWKDGWWPYATPSTAEVTIGGCAAMNVNGKNTWKYGPFGSHILAMDVMLASGEVCRLTPEQDPKLFHAFVGSMGLLGIITSITIQLQRITSGYVSIRRRSAALLGEIFTVFAEEEQGSDYLEAWLDGFATGEQLGRGIVTCATMDNSSEATRAHLPRIGSFEQLAASLVSITARSGRSALLPGAKLANQVIYRWGRWNRFRTGRVALFPFTFWPEAAFAGYHAALPEGAETFQAFVPGQEAKEVFESVLQFSQKQDCMPILCIIKKHKRDPFLLSYQVDGFSLELNYARTPQTAQKLKQVLQEMIAMVIEAGGRFYFAKDHYLTQAQYRQSVGEEAIDTFLHLKQCYDPEMLLQSDLFRRIFEPTLRQMPNR
jgi:decaprenylphospho-beta-D-ribofuranose 2-oxidase